MDFVKLVALVLVLLIGSSWSRHVPQSPNYPSQLFTDMMNDLRKAYEAKQNGVHKRHAQQEEHSTELEILQGSELKRRFLENLQQTNSQTVPQSPNYPSQLFSDLMNDLRKAYEAKRNGMHRRHAKW